jgi:hypothetical protein
MPAPWQPNELFMSATKDKYLRLLSLETEPVFLNVYEAQESILRNELRQPM